MRRSVVTSVSVTAGECHSPLEKFDRAFLTLGTAPRPLRLPAHLVCGHTEADAWPVDRVPARLAHPGTSASQREELWSEVIRRVQGLGEPWPLVAVGMTVPALRRMLRRHCLPRHLERADVEQTALAAVTTALSDLTAGQPEPHRVLFNAADRDIHRLLYAARQRELREWSAPLGQPEQSVSQEHVLHEQPDEYSVLAGAVQAGVLKVEEARVIALTRLEKQPLREVAKQRRMALATLSRHRSAAEGHLTAYLERRAREA